MVESIYRLYKKLNYLLGTNIGLYEIKHLCLKYRTEGFNLFNFISDCTILNISHVSILTSSIEHPEIPFPILVKAKSEHKYYLITKRAKNIFTLYDPTLDEFKQFNIDRIFSCFESWSVLVESIPISVKKGSNNWYSNPFQNELVIPIILLTFFLLLFLFVSPLSFTFYLVYFLSLTGLLICLRLKQKEGPFEIFQNDEFCENVKLNFSCNKILSSPYSRLLNLVSFVDIGMVYFLYLFLYILLIINLSENSVFPEWYWLINIIALISMAILFIVQAVLIRAYCPLCIIIFSIVTAINIFSNIYLDYQGWDKWGITLFCLILSIAIITYYSRSLFFLNSYMSSNLKRQSLLNDHALFRSFYQAEATSVPLPSTALVINYSSDAQFLEITISDTCSFCKKFIFEMLKLLLMTDRYSLSIKVNNEPPDSLINVSNKILWLDKTVKELCENYHEYFNFSIIDKGNVMFKGNLDDIKSQYLPKQLLGRSLTSTYKVAALPTAFLNGRLIPKIYAADKIKLHLVLWQYA